MALLQGGLFVVARVGLVERDAVISRVSIGNTCRPEVLLSNLPVVLADEHSEGLPQDLAAALWMAFGTDVVRDVHDCPSVVPVEAVA